MLVSARTARQALPTLAVAAAALVAACAPSRPPTERVMASVPVTTAPAVTADAVRWEDYAPGVRARIDAWAAGGDCERLADTRDEAAGRVTDAGGAALVAYLDRALREAGCG